MCSDLKKNGKVKGNYSVVKYCHIRFCYNNSHNMKGCWNSNFCHV